MHNSRISVSLFRHIILKGYKQFRFSTEISLGFLWINLFYFFYFSATTDFPYAFFFFQKRALIVALGRTCMHLFYDVLAYFLVTCDL